MNDEEEPELSGLSAADEARIRALLAGAKHDEPMPDAVVARLDRVLAGLAEEPVERPLPATVVSLAERRRRATRMLVAAAAVVVLGVGIGQVVSHSNGTLDSAGSGAAKAGADNGLTDGTDSKELTGSDSGGAGVPLVPAPQSDAPKGASAFELRPQHFAVDSRRVQSQAESMTSSDAINARGYAATCERGHWGAGKYVPVRYGRTPGYLVLRRHAGDSQVADLFLCGGDDPVRSVTLPGP